MATRGLFAPGLLDDTQTPSSGQPGLLDNSFTNFLSTNPNMLLGLGAGIMQGGLGQGFQGAASGMQADQKMRAQRALIPMLKARGMSNADIAAISGNPELLKMFAPLIVPEYELHKDPESGEVGSYRKATGKLELTGAHPRIIKRGPEESVDIYRARTGGSGFPREPAAGGGLPPAPMAPVPRRDPGVGPLEPGDFAPGTDGREKIVSVTVDGRPPPAADPPPDPYAPMVPRRVATVPYTSGGPAGGMPPAPPPMGGMPPLPMGRPPGAPGMPPAAPAPAPPPPSFGDTFSRLGLPAAPPRPAPAPPAPAAPPAGPRVLPGGGTLTPLISGEKKAPEGEEWVTTPDGRRILSPIEGGSRTHVPVEVAGKVAMIRTIKADLPDASERLSRSWAAGKLTPREVYDWSTGSGEVGRAQRTVRIAIESAIRVMSGANTPENEIKNYADMFMPKPMETKETAEQKLRYISEYIRNAEATMLQGREPYRAGGASPPVPGGGSPMVDRSDPLGLRKK